jgi:hypothetical protein
MKHKFLPHITMYISCATCGFVQDSLSDKDERCAGCGEPLRVVHDWFPDSVYEYVMLLEDYHQRPVSKLRKEYFKAVKEDNEWAAWFEGPESKLNPTQDWQPVTILLYRSLFEKLLEHFLWRMMYIQLLPSASAESYPYFILDQLSTISDKIGKGYKFVTGKKWKDDLKELGFESLDQLLIQTAKVRNKWVHESPIAGHNDSELAEKARASIPSMIELFVQLANRYFHPLALSLSKIEIVCQNDSKEKNP